MGLISLQLRQLQLSKNPVLPTITIIVMFCLYAMFTCQIYFCLSVTNLQKAYVFLDRPIGFFKYKRALWFFLWIINLRRWYNTKSAQQCLVKYPPYVQLWMGSGAVHALKHVHLKRLPSISCTLSVYRLLLYITLTARTRAAASGGRGPWGCPMW